MENKKKFNIIRTQRYHSPCGDLILGSFGDKLCLCDWTIEKHRIAVDKRILQNLQACYEEKTSDTIEKAVRQLDEYFNRERTTFDIPLLFIGTEFQKNVWYKLMEIPYGKTISYGELAKLLGVPKAVRAVAMQMEQMPFQFSHLVIELLVAIILSQGMEEDLQQNVYYWI